MAKMTIALCALLGLLVLASMGETMPGRSCCTRFQREPLPLDRIRGYSLDRPGTCRLNAVRLLTIKNRIVCADPKQQWVQDAMEFIRNQTSTA